MLDLLAPSELALNQTRIYVYNMNSAFRQVTITPLGFILLLTAHIQEMFPTPFASIHQDGEQCFPSKKRRVSSDRQPSGSSGPFSSQPTPSSKGDD